MRARGSGSSDGAARIWNARGVEDAKIRQANKRSGLLVLPKGGSCVLTGGSAEAQVWCPGNDTSTTVPTDENVTAAALSSDGNRAFIGTESGEIVRWDLTAPPRKEVLFSRQSGAISSLALSADEDLLAGIGIGANNQLVLCTIKTSKCSQLDPKDWGLTVPGGSLGWGKSLDFSSRQTELLGTAHDGSDGRGIALLWNLKNHTLESLTGHNERLVIIRFSRCSDLVLTVAIQEETARIWDTSSGKLRGSLKGHQDRITSARFSPNCDSGIAATSGKAKSTTPRGRCGSVLVRRLELRGRAIGHKVEECAPLRLRQAGGRPQAGHPAPEGHDIGRFVGAGGRFWACFARSDGDLVRFGLISGRWAREKISLCGGLES